MLSKYSYMLFFLLLGISCSQIKTDASKEVVTLNERKEIPKLLHGYDLVCSTDLWGMKIDFVNGNQMFIQELSNTDLYGKFQIRKDTLIREKGFLKRGNGPYEVVNPFLWRANEKDSIYIVNSQGVVTDIYKLHVKDIHSPNSWERIKFPTIKEGALIYPSLAMLDNVSCIVAGSIVNDINILSQINLRTGEMASLDFNFPRYNYFSQIKAVEHMAYCDASVLKRPESTRLLYTCKIGRYVVLLDYDGNKINNQTELFSTYPTYNSESNYKLIKENDCLRGVIPQVTADFIYCLIIPYTREEALNMKEYKGLPNYFGDELVVFNWEGKRIASYCLDKPICHFNVTPDNKYIYASTFDEDNIVIRKFILPDTISSE